MHKNSLQKFANTIRQWGLELGFQQIGITDTDLSLYEARFKKWLAADFHGDMKFLHKHGDKRYRPTELIPGTLRVISARMDYLPPDTHLIKVLNNPKLGYIARYALGKDYHKHLRKRLAELIKKINAVLSADSLHEEGYRAFCDSAPVLEKPIAEKAGLGFIGKHTNLINTKAGSWFFLGEIYTNLALPVDPPTKQSHCGSCRACIDICPTQAIIAPYQLDARRCISYLTIEWRGSIPVEFRKAIGNRIFGCDDCQIVCPWNKFAKYTEEQAFYPRHQLHAPDLVDLFSWSEHEFLERTAGSPIRRIGYDCWLRNLAIALGNAQPNATILAALRSRLEHPSELVREHVQWALGQRE